MVRDGFVQAWDDVSHKYLDPENVAQARQAEMAYFEKMWVYTRVHRDEVKKCGGKIIDARWVDVNKTDETNPDYRSRLVGKHSVEEQMRHCTQQPRLSRRYEQSFHLQLPMNHNNHATNHDDDETTRSMSRNTT